MLISFGNASLKAPTKTSNRRCEKSIVSRISLEACFPFGLTTIYSLYPAHDPVLWKQKIARKTTKNK